MGDLWDRMVEAAIRAGTFGYFQVEGECLHQGYGVVAAVLAEIRDYEDPVIAKVGERLLSLRDREED